MTNSTITIDMAAEYLNQIAAMQYGKFVNSTYPWLNWEPSTQEELVVIADSYIDKGILHPEGFKFSINIDPAQLEGTVSTRESSRNRLSCSILNRCTISAVFLGSRSGTSWNQCLGHDGEQPIVTSVVLPSSASPNASTPVAALVTFFQVKNTTQLQSQVTLVYEHARGVAVPQPPQILPVMSSTLPAFASALPWNSTSALLLLCDSAAPYCSVGFFNYASLSVSFTGKRTFTTSVSMRATL